MTLMQAARVLYDMQPKRPFIFAHFLWQIAQGKVETPEGLNEAQQKAWGLIRGANAWRAAAAVADVLHVLLLIEAVKKIRH